jgi:hypothetical protein
MCLNIKKEQKPIIATEDIACYKFLRESDGILITPYQHTHVKIGETYSSNLVAEYFEDLTDAEVSYVLHSYERMKSIDTAVYLSSTAYDIKVVECVIPAGSSYYVGTHNGVNSYASDKLFYKRIVSFEEYIQSLDFNYNTIMWDYMGERLFSAEEALQKYRLTLNIE